MAKVEGLKLKLKGSDPMAKNAIGSDPLFLQDEKVPIY
ncbi:hypothetical protein CTDIVETGP_2257 [Clostridium tyrobutyricum DIVETGP]|uniref:Uncharacterized protein n=1 Tax=Clostridium tyrobutyricum DIVETGP TaxID=1408889 RepID=W6NJP3_CLOTY|nr:hypothetical protein CTK_C04820 [Clostridium tyrobutyricum]CDL92187.1 hypothetical protein CTDIVETGP_2257 [Clostridium tyrobutyricum DIVETGP]